MPSCWDAATHGWSRRVFHYPLPTLMSKNFRLPCTIELQPLSLTPLKMRKVELGVSGVAVYSRYFCWWCRTARSNARPMRACVPGVSMPVLSPQLRRSSTLF